ncbi:hypothetical protein TIFTF001_013338 [Ficus carica]|uniref:Uncharacterized protein n=1 Tax=Ficus carica TaxID=3494 RepID=A0AA88A0R2_FICCA|nr:hypothetical protein TIFTF001_013338 [Ficus carica]
MVNLTITKETQAGDAPFTIRNGVFSEEIGASVRSQNRDREALTKKLLEKNPSLEKTINANEEDRDFGSQFP